MSTNTQIASKVTPTLELTPNFFNAAGIDIKVTDKAKAAARAYLERSGARLVPDKKADTVYVVAANALSAAKTADNAQRTVAISLAAIDKSNAASSITSPDGKAYASTHALFKDLFPTMSDSSISNYLGVGRDVYIPALMGTLSGNETANASFASLPFSVALELKSTLNKEDYKPKLIEAVAEIATKGKVLSKTVAKDMVSKVRGKSKDKPADKPAESADKTDKAGKQGDLKASQQIKFGELQAFLKKVLQPEADADNGLTTFTLFDRNKEQLANFFRDAQKDADSAMMAIRALAWVLK